MQYINFSFIMAVLWICIPVEKEVFYEFLFFYNLLNFYWELAHSKKRTASYSYLL
jgi:hypothetical protein